MTPYSTPTAISVNGTTDLGADQAPLPTLADAGTQAQAQAQIHSTRTYTAFTHPVGQRPVDSRRVAQIAESMKQRGFIPGYHILVNQNLEVIDGQHRLAAAQIAGVPVYYSIEQSLAREDVSVLAEMTKSWTNEDYLAAYIAQGRQEYIKLSAYQEKHGLPLSVSVSLLYRSTTEGGAHMVKFRTGGFTCDNLEFAELVAQRVLSFEQHLKHCRLSPFVRAIAYLSRCEHYNHRVMLHRLSQQGGRLVQCATQKDYLILLQDIYNYRARERVEFVRR